MGSLQLLIWMRKAAVYSCDVDKMTPAYLGHVMIKPGLCWQMTMVTEAPGMQAQFVPELLLQAQLKMQGD